MWTCSKCHSEVEDSFDVCWSCGTGADGVEDPSFVTADEAEPIIDPDVDLAAPLDDSLEDFAGVPLPDLAECFLAGNVTEARFVADRLMEQGIPAVADTHDGNAVVGGGHGPRVRVLPKDVPRARAWVMAYEERRKEKRYEAD